MSALRIAINGFGRIGRNLLRAYLSHAQQFADVQIIAINDVADSEVLLHLFKFDSTHGRLDKLGVSASVDADDLCLSTGDGQKRITMLHQANPDCLPWKELGVDLVLECTGKFRSYQDASLHLAAGAKQVIIGAAPFDEVDASVVVGVNDEILSRKLPIISGVSCTTQALVPLLSLLDEKYGINCAMMTEIHALTADQSVLDQAHRDLRRARAGSHNIIPTTSSSINATERVLPQMKGKINGHSIRVPTINVAAIDLAISFINQPSLVQLQDTLKSASYGKLAGVMGYTDEPLVSSDFIGDARSLIIDGQQTMQSGSLFKVYAWYDNEWGYANRLLDMCQLLAQR